MTTYVCEDCGRGVQLPAGREEVWADRFFVFFGPRPTHEPRYFCSAMCLRRWAEVESGVAMEANR